MYAVAAKLNPWEHAFCLTISWLEQYYGEKVLIIEADETNGRLILLGDQELCAKFNSDCLEMLQTVQDPADWWRTANGND